jgi:hypothetical protein
MKEETKCYCGHTTYCDCGPEINVFKHEVKVISKEEILANRSNAYEFVDIDKQETLEEALLEDIKFLLLAKSDALAIRLIEKYGHNKQQERSYSEEEVSEIIAESWNSCEDNEGETFTEARKRILEAFKKK